VKSLTLDYAGVTRDFIKDTVTWQSRTFDLIDSGGITASWSKDPILQKVREAVINLIEQAGLILFVCDGTTGILPEDRAIARLLHKLGKPVILVVNKMDKRRAQEQLYEFERLGFSPIIPVSAEHGTGIHELLDVIVRLLPVQTVSPVEPAYKVVLLGRPNVGKSSLLNALVQEERSIVSDVPGTTREAVSERINFYKETIELTDTAGIRRKRAVSGKLEPLMVKSSMQALKDADIVLLLIDAHEHSLVDQDLKLAFYAFAHQYKSLILLVNKSDLLTEINLQDLERRFDYYKHLIKKIPVLFISAKTGKNIGKILPLIKKVWERSQQQFDSVAITKLFKAELIKKPLYHKTQPLLVYRAEQVTRSPITIVMEVNEPLWFQESQQAFFENILRSNYNLIGVPVKFIFRK
jgi:GTP-binding protein